MQLCTNYAGCHRGVIVTSRQAAASFHSTLVTLLSLLPDLAAMSGVQSMVKHKSRLQVEKEQAVQQRKAEEAAQAQRAKRKVIHTPGSWSKQVCL